MTVRDVNDYIKSEAKSTIISGELYTMSKVKLNFNEENIVCVSFNGFAFVVDIKTSAYQTKELVLRDGLFEAFEERFPEYLISVPMYDDVHEADIPF